MELVSAVVGGVIGGAVYKAMSRGLNIKYRYGSEKVAVLAATLVTSLAIGGIAAAVLDLFFKDDQNPKPHALNVFNKNVSFIVTADAKLPMVMIPAAKPAAYQHG